MAEVAVSFVLRKLADVALKEALDLYQVSDQVEPMKLELRLIQCFLRDADSKRNKNPLVKQWVKEVRDMAYRIEDAIDTFLVEIEKNRPKSYGIINKFKRLGKNPVKLSGLSDEIKKIQETLKTIYERRTHLGIVDIGAGSEENSGEPFRPSKLSDIDVSDVVGFDSQKSQIIAHLLDRSISRRTVLSIVGIGGLGKTTLAQKVYKSAELEGQFDCRTWLPISQKFNLTNLSRELLYSIEPEMQKEQAIVDKDLPTELKKSLTEKRYLIILDDVWTVDLWDRLKIALPDMKNGSRVLITSRSLDVAIAADSETLPYKLSYLTEDESLTLLLKKAYPQGQPNNHPPDLIKVAKRLMKKCDGLPLALVVVGGILSRRERTYSAWLNVEHTMDWHNKEGEKCSQILAMSYEDLPFHLKPCFLYFASFPEDYKISANHVTRMWIAEGFIPNDGVGTLEDKAKIYLEELAQRCLVQVIEKFWNDYCKYCSIHDLLRDLAIHEAKEDNFLTVFSKLEDDVASGARRASIQILTPIDGDHSITRSLHFFGQYTPNYCGFRLLRVLTIEHVNLSGKNVANSRWLEDLIHLRYLGFRYSQGMPYKFGRVSFSSLKNLETLDLKGTTEIDDEPHHSLWEIPTLRHVISSNIYTTRVIHGPSKWNYLKNLQTLKWLSPKNIDEQGCNINLRKMGLRIYSDFLEQCGSIEQAQQVLKGFLKRMEHLVSLHVLAYELDHLSIPFPIDGTCDLPCHEKIQSLYLGGKWPSGIVLNVEMLPTNLTKFTLLSSELQQDPMPILERLQSLRILRLKYRSYVGTELICSTGGFPSLQKLELGKLQSLNHWDIKEGAMPILSQLRIYHCDVLRELPELQKVPTLRVLSVFYPTEELRERMQSADLYKIKHIPSVRIE